jgi:hypothetical protein
MAELLNQDDRAAHSILATSGFADDRTRVLKQGDTFAVLDHCGGMKPGGLGEEGLYHEGTRFLSCLSMDLEGKDLFFLGPSSRAENGQLAVALTNPDQLAMNCAFHSARCFSLFAHSFGSVFTTSNCT